jgi:hypothetical protein
MSVVDDEGEQEILVLPITHTPPANPAADAVEIPAETKNRLGLDFDRSWIVISEANEFLWPGPDLRAIPGRDDSTIAYGTLPPRFFAPRAREVPRARPQQKIYPCTAHRIARYKPRALAGILHQER